MKVFSDFKDMNIELLLNCQTFIIDLDGVVYRGNQLLDGVQEGINILRNRGKKVKFLTNSSKMGADGITEKLNNLGIQCDSIDVMTSATASAAYLYEESRKNIYVIGDDGLKEEILKTDLNVVVIPEQADALLVGIDSSFSYQKISDAMVCLNSGSFFVACNRDPNFPVSREKYLPGCGAMVASIEVASERKADIEIGKPSMYILQQLLSRDDDIDEKIAVVGDSVESDIGLAMNFGVPGVHINEKYNEKDLELSGSYFKFKSILHLAKTLVKYT